MIVGVVPQGVGIASTVVGIPIRLETAKISHWPSLDTQGVNTEDDGLFLFNDFNHAMWIDNITSDKPHVAEDIVGAITEVVGAPITPSEIGHITRRKFIINN